MAARTRGSWTTPADIRDRVRRRWDDGSLLTAWAAEAPFPVIDLPVRGPKPAEIGADTEAVRRWVADLETGSRNRYELDYAQVGGRLIGRNRLPSRARLTSYEQAWSLLGTAGDVARLRELLELTAVEPRIRTWVAAQPLRALAAKVDWQAVLAAYAWLDRHRGSGRYLREISAPGVDTKFVEQHRALLARLLDVPSSTAGFATALGLQTKPELIRLRCDAGFLGLPHAISDVSFVAAELACARVSVSRAVIVENETTFLSLPVPHEGVLIWGKGFDVDRAGSLPWLQDAAVHYWGDLDTHGFAILDRLRAWLPHTQSFLMDRETLVSHRDRWVTEGAPTAARLDRLTPSEATLYGDLVTDHFGESVRLEQERIDWSWVEERLPES